ncbi:ATP-binding SpoIIE family protein phosphatase [Streptomyces boncukensis]|uniref:SpoIIE family protein phosphatase n=1 Tax=Streptomyces boncukensis TaxID=2711219 RepID=A0A6G4WWI1_9ACTN|nr:SpoIIE family protein phosphatase [Streptomyces boncukensis]NGO68980.1 SpoIIE family protein phosphatase [Streptomyces boncukensis]
MRTEEALSATGAGLWTWDIATGLVTLDVHAAYLLGITADPARPAPLTLQGNTVRSHFHAVDYVTFRGVLTLALSEGAPVETSLRVVGREGSVIRTVRTLIRPLDTTPAEICGPGSPESTTRIVGLLYEVPEPGPEDAGGDPAARSGPRNGSAADEESGGGPAASGGWDWRRNREAFLLDAGRALAEAHTTADVLRVASSLAMPGFAPDLLTVYSLDGDRLRTLDGSERSVGTGMDHPVAEAARTSRAIYLADPDEYARRYPDAALYVSRQPRERRARGHCRAYLPLVVAGSVIGVWMTGYARPVAFTPDERAVLTTVARMLAQTLSRVMVNESERELSAGLQRTMRPARKPVIPGMELAARYIPTGGGLQVGGDWYDVIPLPSGRTALVIGDVQGHDVRAAGIMGQLRIALRAYASEGHHPDAVLARASRFLYGMAGASAGDPQPESAGRSAGEGAPTAVTGPESPGDAEAEADNPRFATCLYIEVDPASGTLDIARAGHPDPAVQMPGGPMRVRPTAGGLPLGIDPDSDYPTTRLVLEPGERLLMCTDGLIETGGHDLETGWDRIREVVDEYEAARDPAAPAQDAQDTQDGPYGLEGLADALVQAVLGPPGSRPRGPLPERHEDDIALLLLTPGPGARGAAPGGAAGSARRGVLSIAQAEPDRIAEARHGLRAMLHDWSDGDQVDGAVLMLSEMLTNVLVHTDSDALLTEEITGELGARTLRVEVRDGSDELPHRRSPGELASSGRGLVLMEMLADRWGVEPHGEGKCIWFEMRERVPET